MSFRSRRRFIKFVALLWISKPSFAIINTKINRINSMRIWSSHIYTRLIIEASHEIDAKFFALTNPTRFVIDVFNTSLNTVVIDFQKNFASDSLIQNVNTGQNTKTTVRIVLYTSSMIFAQAHTLQPINFDGISYKYRYIVDIYPTKKQEVLNDQLLALLQLKSDKQNDNDDIDNVTQTMVSRQINTKKILVIDPGHGGEDPGAIGANGTKEKNVVLDIAKKLYELINATKGIKAILTRNQDIFIPLNTRVVIAEKIKADLFISIHADAFTSPAPSGSSVFVLSKHGSSSVFAKYLETTQNRSDLIGGLSKANDKLVNQTILDMAQSITKKNSFSLAHIVLTQLQNVNKLHSHKVENAGFAVLKAPDIPSILIESAFISNKHEEYLLNQDSFRAKIALVIFYGVIKYINHAA